MFHNEPEVVSSTPILLVNLKQTLLKGVCLLHLLSENIFPVLTRAPLGGGADSAPPLSNIRDNLRTT